MVDQMKVFGYTVFGTSFILSKISPEELNRVKCVILFGSVASGSATGESDIDLFFDVDMPSTKQKSFRSKLNKLIEEFYLSNIALSYKINSISGEFSIKVGKVDEWPELARSMASNGVILYGKYSKQPSDLKSYTILSWERPKKAKGALLNKMYGYIVNGKKYPGLVRRYSGVKIGIATIMVPSDSRDVFINTLEKYKVNYSRFDVWV